MTLLLFLLTGLLVFLIMSLVEGGARVETAAERLQRLVAQRKALEGFATRDLPGAPLPPADERRPRPSLRMAVQQTLVGAVERATTGSSTSNRLEAQLTQADWKWKPAEFMVAQAVAAGGGLLASVLALPQLWFLFAIGGWVLPKILLRQAIAKRQRLFGTQLPDALAMIANAMRSGYSFLQAMDVVSREMPAPINKEFELALKEARVNIPVEEALQHMVKRVQSPDLDLVVTAVLIQRQVGGNLSEILEKIGDTIRDRIRMQGEVRSLTAQGRMSGWIISLLPVALGLLMHLIMPGAMTPLFTHPIGIALLVMGVVMQGLGIFMIRRMVNLEV